MVTNPAGAPGITAAEAITRTAPPATAVLLDVRGPDEWHAGHAPHAVHLPMAAIAANRGLPAELAGRPVAVICRSGGRSRQVADFLAAQGADVVDVAGGMYAWAAAGGAIVDGLGRPGTVA